MQWWMKKGRPRFAKPVGNELWCMLLEKAFAKFFGSYESLVGGICSVAFQCLTGSAEQFVWDKEGGKLRWERGRVAVEEQTRRRTIVTTFEPDQFATDEELFEVFREYDKKHFIISCSISAGEEKTRPDGLVEGHAYSMLQVASLPHHGRLKLCKLRNPWGGGATHEWNGDFSDTSSGWGDQLSGLREELKAVIEHDGIFWMTWSDFTGIFNHACMSPRSMAKESVESAAVGSSAYLNGPGMKEDMGWDKNDEKAEWDDKGLEEPKGDWKEEDLQPQAGGQNVEDHFTGEGEYEDPADFDDGGNKKEGGKSTHNVIEGEAKEAKEVGPPSVKVPAV
uniref:Calpain catalytic domain-containing protein n=1 Tax=Chromera velia CCMP2878 TaxID=1169474 RepID=A0A0G4F556_9ALVE|eukprot:Cvel_15134.t1-p1 / transcript=Cvel_15134.t1 / gene=Cvel_15134 / organism=Chromera_velia_CCMP2878 / gene_product=Calpain-8, putative / transcript_product=Calpain-8, putative / location=Cvel_scaffold1104:32432-34339(+) / protein_length=335 / sequence_SO=supercontig / SO=protein_coding / is_pseudo=false